MNNVRTRANEDYRQRRSYRSRRGNHMVTICLYVGIISFLCIISGIVLLLYTYFKYMYYSATNCTNDNLACKDTKSCFQVNPPNITQFSCLKNKDPCAFSSMTNVNGNITYSCKYDTSSDMDINKLTIFRKNNKIAHILLYSGAGLLITTLIIYNVF